MSVNVDAINSVMRQVLEEEISKNSSLSEAESVKADLDFRIGYLLDIGYITPNEEQKYREPLRHLPEDRKSLIIAYYLSSYFDVNATDIDYQESEKEAIRKIMYPNGVSAKEYALTSNGSISIETGRKLKEAIFALNLGIHLHKAEIFVDSYRRRLRAALIKPMRLDVASSLLENEQLSTLSAIAERNGYEPEAESIDERCRATIEEASAYRLDVIELSLLNGEFTRRENEIYSKYEQGELIPYEDDIDETLLPCYYICILFDEVISRFYNVGTAKDMTEYIRAYTSGELDSERSKGEVSFKAIDEANRDAIQGTKFKYLIEEGLC